MSAQFQMADAATLRRAFDESFARPPQAEAAQAIELLSVLAREARLALRVGDMRGLHLCPDLSEIPAQANALVGVGAVRGELVGVYSLAALRGGGKAAAGRWLVVCGDGSVGLTFDEVLGYARVAPQELARAAGDGRLVVTLEGRPHVVVDMPGLLKEITGA